MARKILAVALGLLVTTLPLARATAVPNSPGAPEGTASTRYCLRVDPITGSRIETIQCRTRDDWASLEVDVDQEWAENGVRVIA